MDYQFKKGTRVKGVTAQVVGEEIEAIRQQDGIVLTEKVVAVAKDKSSPLHSAFEWNNSKAGHQYRLIQARQMINAVEVVYEESTEPAFVHVQIDKQNYYQSASVAAQNHDEWEVVRKTALSRLASAGDTLDQLNKVAAKARPDVSSSARTLGEKIRQGILSLQEA